MPTSEYTKQQLTEMHVQAFRAICSQHERGNVVGVGSWILRVSNDSVQLVTSYSVKNTQTGNWSDTQENTIRL